MEFPSHYLTNNELKAELGLPNSHSDLFLSLLTIIKNATPSITGEGAIIVEGNVISLIEAFIEAGEGITVTQEGDRYIISAPLDAIGIGLNDSVLRLKLVGEDGVIVSYEGNGEWLITSPDIAVITAQLAAIVIDLTALHTQVDELAGAVLLINNDISTLTADVSTLNGQVANIEGGLVPVTSVQGGAGINVTGNGTTATPYIITSAVGGGTIVQVAGNTTITGTGSGPDPYIITSAVPNYGPIELTSSTLGGTVITLETAVLVALGNKASVYTKPISITTGSGLDFEKFSVGVYFNNIPQYYLDPAVYGTINPAIPVTGILVNLSTGVNYDVTAYLGWPNNPLPNLALLIGPVVHGSDLVILPNTLYKLYLAEISWYRGGGPTLPL
jgi:hypothetical protein